MARTNAAVAPTGTPSTTRKGTVMSMYTSKMKSVSSSLGMIALLSALILSVSPALAGDDKAATGPVDLNSADEATLQTLPGVGPGIAKQIVAARPFASVEDLAKVKGIGPAKLAILRGKVTVKGAKPASAPPAVTVPFPSARPAPLAPGATKSPASLPLDKVNINTASESELETLLGIGPVKAKAIVAGRPYAKIEDVMKVPGIKAGIFAKIKNGITVE